ncbi:MAG TPA: CDP-diacylglycerol--glycerol-3-phosphate 3-phosphatidyltransferase [Polyangia bacterium]|jgi:CDP-diacylglycerol--glycerol-3-phosphate 3-phosphatidyltransferase
MTAVEGPSDGGNLRNELTNLPNLITIGRVLLVPFVLLMIDNYNPLRTFLASLLYIGAAAGDALDGYLARKRNQVSVLGKFLDPLADKLIVTAVLVTMVALGRAPAWLVVVLIGRDLAINGLRSIASAQGLVIAASDGGKIKTALQLVAIMMLLIHFRYPLLGTELLFGQPIGVDYHKVGQLVLYLSMIVSVVSAVEYVQKFFSAAWRSSRATP